MIKNIKIIGITLFLLVFWIFLMYFMIAFYKLEMNVLKWEVENRCALILPVIGFIIFTPLIMLGISEMLNKPKK